jgi:hypothetical protein
MSTANRRRGKPLTLSPPTPIMAASAQLLRAPRAAGVAGIAFALLYSASVILLRGSLVDPNLAQSARLGIVGLYLAPFAGIAFLWFIAVIRARIGDQEDRFFATVFLGSGLLFVAMLFVGSAAVGSLVTGTKFQGLPPPLPESVLYTRALSYAILLVYASKVSGVFIMTASTIMLRLKTLPRLVALAGYLIALFSIFSVTYIGFTVFLFPIWAAVVSVFILIAPWSAKGGS